MSTHAIIEREKLHDDNGGGARIAPSPIGARAVGVGALLCAGVAALNAYLETALGVHFVGGTQLPLGAVFVLLVLVLGFNGPVKKWNAHLPRPLVPAELVAIYSMCGVAALISTPGNENSFLTTGASLFYFSNRSNGWAKLFYHYIPRHFAPGWDGQNFNRQVIDKLYLGGVSAGQVPWHAWAVMLTGWSIFSLFLYGWLFFTTLLFRRQWVENEALSFPLVQLALDMVEPAADGTAAPGTFWQSRLMWMGFGIACVFHLLRGMNFYFPDWPPIGSFQGNQLVLSLPDKPWSAMGAVDIEFFFGAAGIAYLLTREVSFSFWFFYVATVFQLVVATQLGFSPGLLPADSYTGQPTFISFGAAGGWLMMAAMLIYSARLELRRWFRAALLPNPQFEAGEPFSARFTVGGFLGCALGLSAWCDFSGMNPIPAILFWGVYAVVALVLARLVVESGAIFPQVAFSTQDLLTKAMVGTPALGPATITHFAVLQPSTFADMRSNLLPAFLHTLKMGHDLDLKKDGLRRLMSATALAVAISFAVSIVTILTTMYSRGGLATYGWFTQGAGQQSFGAAASSIAQNSRVEPVNWLFIAIGAVTVLLLTMARARFLWFPFHPLGFLVASSYSTRRLAFSFFVGWLVKTLILKFGGSKAVQDFRPFAIGLILGNATAMMIWMVFGLFQGNQIGYWPA